ncbi:hypothetical protein SAMN05421767_1303 [Granulicatella balaenopterae]|uniref:Uncharacterized protein n=1 Tax=Granulicatella balaenopterae TaxID=137733 RepID=A0A1H9MTN5_9LACT|nr:hypothetical protein [Granulicatella balaenopterae]SER26839.1 hypothetical protein SAMN05421767_1303 [Granulicatella balaenopterae]
MDYRKILVFLKNEDKTESIQTISKVDNKYDVRFHSQPTQPDMHGEKSVVINHVQEEIDPTQTVIINGVVANNIKEMYDFGEWYRIVYDNKDDKKDTHKLYLKDDVEICANKVNTANARKIFNYIKGVASGKNWGILNY